MLNNKIKILENPKEIVKYLRIETIIPQIPQFHKYIIGDIKFYSAKSIFLEEIRTHKVVSNLFVYDDGGEISHLILEYGL